MKIICDSCSTKYSIADEKVRGKVFKIKCKKCSHIIVVRGASPEPEGYDDKETRVVDYQGGDPAAAAAAMAAGEAVWHLVVDQQQVGPMTVQEVEQRFSAGEIDADSYVWKEGFGDWQRLADVPEFASIAGASGPAAAAPAPSAGADPVGDGVAPTGALAAAAAAGGPSGGEDAVAGMFGGPAVDDGGGAQDDPADLFSAASGDSGAAGDPAGDLFGGGGGGSAPAADDASAGLFGGAPAADAPAPVQAQADVGDAGGGNLTGQRNENSVLFSLSNLASLAADAPKSSAPAASSSPSSGAGMAESGGQEGSGLIDIRSMAAVYLGDQKQPGGPAAPAGPAATDDLPSFGGGSAFGGSQVLLPVSQSSGTNQKTLYALIGAIGFLAIVAIVLVVVLVGGGDDKPQVAAQGVEQPGAAAGAAGAAALPDDGDDDDDEPEPAAAEPEPEPEPAAAAEPDPEPDPEPEPEAKDDDDDDDRGSSRRSRRDRRDSRRNSRSKPEPKKEERKSPPRTEKCDEVACLVDPSLPCCGGGSKSRSRGSSSSKSSSKDLPERPSRGDVTNGIGKVRGRVLSCGDKHGFKGTVTVKIKIAGSGKVAGASANQGSGAFKSCVTSAAKRAKFPKTQKGITVNYPFVFR